MVVINKGIFIVRFRSMEKRDSVFVSNMVFFYSKPIIIKA